MAKKPVKSAVKKIAKPVTPPASKAVKRVATSKSKKTRADTIEKTCEEVLKKLRSLNIEPGLQADIQWCLGSYRNDKNPSGLYIMVEKALPVLKTTSAKDVKAVPAKFLSDLEKALKKR